MLTITFRNLLIGIKTTSRISVLIISTFSFLLILSSLPVSYYNHQIDSLYYNSGAEIILAFPLDSPSFNEVRTQLSLIDGLGITTISQTGIVIEDNKGNPHDIRFFGIEENFYQIAHWHTYYDDQSLTDLVQSLFNSSGSYPIILDSITAQEERLNVNDLYAPFEGESKGITFSVAGISDYWPDFIIRRSPFYHYLITKKSLIENISTTAINYYGISGSMSTGDRIWGKGLPGYDTNLIIDQVLAATTTAKFDGSISFVKSHLESNSQQQKDQFLWLITNFDFLDSLIVGLSVILLFTMIRISAQSTELGLSRALGMKYKQVFFLLFLEPLILFFISGIPGAVIGLLFLIFSASILSPLLIPAPPFILEYNILVMIFVFIFIFGVMVLTGLITSFKATKANISEILKVE